jgi:hypothetical protein
MFEVERDVRLLCRSLIYVLCEIVIFVIKGGDTSVDIVL